MGTFSRYSSSPSRRTRRISRYGGKTAGDKGTRRAGRTESRMQLMRKHRAARKSARKTTGMYKPSQVASQRRSRRSTQRSERRSMYRSQGILSRRSGRSRTQGKGRPTLRDRASARGRIQRVGAEKRVTRYGGSTSRRRDQMRRALRDY